MFPMQAGFYEFWICHPHQRLRGVCWVCMLPHVLLQYDCNQPKPSLESVCGNQTSQALKLEPTPDADPAAGTGRRL
jgi:hypothetical protein